MDNDAVAKSDVAEVLVGKGAPVNYTNPQKEVVFNMSAVEDNSALLFTIDGSLVGI